MASGYLPSATSGVATATGSPQWSPLSREYVRGPDTHPLVPNVSSVAEALDAAVYPTNLYEAQLRHRLRGTR